MCEDIDMFEFWPIYLIAVIFGVLCGLFWSFIIIDRAHVHDIDFGEEVEARKVKIATPTESQQ